MLAAPLLASCGFNEPTSVVYQPAVGTNQRDGRVDVLGTVVVAEGGRGRLIASLVNNDLEQADALLGVRGPGGAVFEPAQPIEIPPGGLANLSTLEPLIAESEEFEPGSMVRLTFTFATAEAVTFQVPVVPVAREFEDFGPNS